MAQVGSARGVGKPQGMPKSIHEHKELVNAWLGAGAAGLLLGWTTSTGKPAAFHALLGVAAVFAIVWSYLQVGRSKATEDQKASAVIAAVIAGAIGFGIVLWLRRFVG